MSAWPVAEVAGRARRGEPRPDGNPARPGPADTDAHSVLAEPYDATTVLTVVADVAQATVMELLRQIWPICREHKK
ncbi:hypothetical protein GCM10010317_097740 [Streptomyces mirabilis]|nr:hypothetical protein GCM10010317_097740 [Streptomyces mirabilis]